MKVLVYGWYNKGNVGDESYKLSFPRLFPGCDFTFTSHLDNSLLDGKDCLVLGGGNILDKKYVSAISKAVRDSGWDKPIHAFSVGYGDLGMTKEDINMFSSIRVRDEKAVSRIASRGYSSVEYCPDAAFCMEPDIENGRRLWKEYYERQGLELYDKKVVVVFNAHLMISHNDVLLRDGLRFFQFAYDWTQIIDHTSASFMFIPFGTHFPWDDRVPNAWIASKCKWHRKNCMVYDPPSIQETLDLIASSDALVTQRFHSTIFATLGCVPFVDIFHHDKNLSFLQENGLEGWGVPYWDFTREKAKSILDSHLSGDSDVSKLVETRDRMQERLKRGANAIRFGE